MYTIYMHFIQKIHGCEIQDKHEYLDTVKESDEYL